MQAFSNTYIRSWFASLATSLWTPALISGVLCALVVMYNLPRDSFVTGGDAFTPELDPRNALERFAGAWNDRAGLGADNSLSHSVLFPIILVDLALTSLRVPPLFINHGWLILAAAAQGLFAARLFLELFRSQTQTAIVPIFVGVASFVNPYVLVEWHQQFPPTLLSIAFFPGSLVTLIAYYRRSQPSYLLAFLLITLTVAVGNYNETTTVVEATLLILTVGALLVFDPGLGRVRRGLQLLIAFFGINLVWWIPVVHFMARSLHSMVGGSNEFSYAALWAVSRSSFLANSVRLIGENKFFHEVGRNLFLPEGPSYEHNVGLILATMVLPLLAFAAPLLRRKCAVVWTILLVTLIALFFAKGLAWPGGWLFRLLFDRFSIFRIFRSSFNHFEWVVVYGYSLLAGVTLNEILRLGSRKRWIATMVIAFSALCLAAYPMFLGHLFWTDMMIRFPRQYFALAKWLAHESDLRVLNLPISRENWDAFRWGYVGISPSANLLYNPLMGGLYDGAPAAAGNKEIDEAFREFPITIGLHQVPYVLGLYGVGYVVDDASIDLTYYGPYHAARISETIPHMQLAKTFDFLHVYRIDSHLTNSRVYAASRVVSGARNLLDEALACRISRGCKNTVFLEPQEGAAIARHAFSRTLGPLRAQEGGGWTPQIVDPAARIVTNSRRENRTVIAIRGGQVDVVARFVHLVPNQTYTLEFNASVEVGTVPNLVIFDGRHLPLVNEPLLVAPGGQQSLSFPLVLAGDADTIDVHLLLDQFEDRPSKVALGPPRLVSESLSSQAAALSPAQPLPTPKLDVSPHGGAGYRVRVSDAPDRYMLVLNASFSPDWRIIAPPGVSTRHVRANLYENAWLIEGRGSYNIFITHDGEYYVWLGLWVGSLSCGLVLASLFLRSKT